MVSARDPDAGRSDPGVASEHLNKRTLRFPQVPREHIHVSIPVLLTGYHRAQLATVWRELPGGVWRSDVGRYLILAAYGGWYSDTDVICELALDEMHEAEQARLEEDLRCI